MRASWLVFGMGMALTIAQTALGIERDTYVFSLSSVPVGLVELTLDKGTSPGLFRYRSIHWLTRDTHVANVEQKLEVQLDATRVPASMWLWLRRPAGCTDVEDERTHRQGEGCVNKSVGREVDGTLFGEKFHATYASDGRLDKLQLGTSTFIRKPGVKSLDQPPPDLFGKAIPVQGREGALQWEPGLAPPAPKLTPWNAAAAKRLTLKVLESFTENEAGDADLAVDPVTGNRGGCLAHARRFERWARTPKGARRAAVVLGFYAAPGDATARAHAWVMVKTPKETLMLDPTLGVPVTPETHIPVGTEYLSVFEGRRHLTRKNVADAVP